MSKTLAPTFKCDVPSLLEEKMPSHFVTLKFNYDFKVKVTKIFIHGFLHLLGFDHIKKKEYKKMIYEEEKIFKSVQKFIK